MRTERPKHTVLVSSCTEGNPYDVGREYDLHAVLYWAMIYLSQCLGGVYD